MVQHSVPLMPTSSSGSLHSGSPSALLSNPRNLFTGVFHIDSHTVLIDPSPRGLLWCLFPVKPFENANSWGLLCLLPSHCSGASKDSRRYQAPFCSHCPEPTLCSGRSGATWSSVSIWGFLCCLCLKVRSTNLPPSRLCSTCQQKPKPTGSEAFQTRADPVPEPENCHSPHHLSKLCSHYSLFL